MKSISTRFLAISAALMLAATVALAQGPHGHGGPDGEFGHMLGFFSHELDLTSDQQAQLKAIWTKEKATLQPLMNLERQNHASMRALEASGPFDEAKTRALVTQNAQTMIELQVQHARIKAEMMTVLTADQKTKLAEIEAQHEARMKDHAPPPPED